MSTVMNPQTPPPAAEKEDPWRYGWRYIPYEEPGGKTRFEQVPLKKEDLLHPEEDHCFTYTDAHTSDCHYLRNALGTQLANEVGTIVLTKCRVDWGVPGLRPHAVDLVVFRSVKTWDPYGVTFTVAPLGAQPVLAIEITSPETCEYDLGVKVDHYRQAGVPFYAIVDRSVAHMDGSVRLLGYRASQSDLDHYDAVPLDPRGWLWLEPVRVWLTVENRRVVCYDERENRIKSYAELMRDIKAAEALIAAVNEARGSPKARIEQLEAELQRLRGQSNGGPANPPAS